jgi:hypothetical protein
MDLSRLSQLTAEQRHELAAQGARVIEDSRKTRLA